MPRKIEISYKSIVFTLLFLLFIYLLFQLQGILITIFIAFIFSSALAPYVDLLETKFKLGRSVSIVIVYIVLWLLLSLLVALVAGPLVDQTSRLIAILPGAIGRIEFLTTHQEEITQQLLGQIGSLPQNLLSIIVSIFGNLFAIFTTIVVGYYLLLERKRLDSHLDQLITSKADKNRFLALVRDIEFHLGGWVRGELVLMFSVGLVIYVGLSILGVDIALPLAIIAGLLEIIPNIGPVISAIPAILIALTIHPAIALGTLALYIAVQFIENNLLVPRIMQQAVGVNPLVIILGLMIGNQLAGPVGAVLAIPAFILGRSLLTHFLPKLNLPHEV